ncbi:MAG: Ig-like domain-containing protein [Actinomycetota bacterium]
MRGLLAPLVLAAFLSAPAGSASASITFDLTWGSVGIGNGNFTLPTRVATDSSGNPYVSDTGNHRIQKFTTSGVFTTKWGATLLGVPIAGTGDGEFNLPSGVATDSSSNVYVADTTNNRIQKFNSTGGFLTKWGSLGTGTSQFNGPQGIATDSSSNVYVADTTNNRIQKFNSTGTYITQWGSAGAGDGQFSLPSGVATDSSGNVYVADAGNSRIQKFDPSGTFIAKWGSAGAGNGQFGTTLDVATGSHGNVIVADGTNNRIQKFRPSGTFITTWGSLGTGTSQFNGPSGVAVASTDHVYVVDRVNNRIQKFHETDTSPPDTTIDTGPSGLTNDTSPSFTFSSTDPSLLSPGFECSLDAAEWASCTSPKAYSSLSDGAHTFQVRAVDAAGNPDPSPASQSFTVDATPPDTTIDSGPSGLINDATPTFGFSSEPGASFQCRFDSDPFGACSGPGDTHTASALADGFHTFYVRAVDAAGNPDPSPASQSFTVDATDPETTIDSGPSGFTNNASPSFAFSSEPGASFQCSLDSSGYTSCSSPQSYSSLGDGPHIFRVRAIDQAGNIDTTAASQSFTVDTTPPETTIDSGPSGLTNDPTPTFSFQSSQAGSSFQCKLNSSGYTSCSSPKTTFHLSDGSRTFYVRAIDKAGNADPTPASRSFTLRTAAVHVSGSTLIVTAAAGAKDNFEITRPSASLLRVTDVASGAYTGSGVHAWAGCNRSGDYGANCSATGITLIQVASLGLNDKVVNSTTIESSLDGGAANDTLIGGPSNDTLTGGTGADVFMGMNGNDELFARDLASDTTIDCGGSNADKADMDVLPMDSSVSGCEIPTRH